MTLPAGFTPLGATGATGKFGLLGPGGPPGAAISKSATISPLGLGSFEAMKEVSPALAALMQGNM